MDYETVKPYQSGPSCQSCPDHCSDNKLCGIYKPNQNHQK